MNICQAGRKADFGGRWKTPCASVFVRHELHSPALGTDPLTFCDRHMQELIDAGLVSDPLVTEQRLAYLMDKFKHERLGEKR